MRNADTPNDDAHATLPHSLVDAFALAAGELGMFTAARLFCEQTHAHGGAPLLAALRDTVGATFPVLDVVAARMGGGEPLPTPDAEPLLEALTGCTRVVVIGSEALLIDTLVDRLPPSCQLAVVLDTTLPANSARVGANFEARATRISVDEVVAWAGTRTALVTPVFGTDGHRAAVCATWLRVMGPDLRASFGRLVGWNLLGAPMEAYPRWLRDTPAGELTAIVPLPVRA